MPDSPGGLSVVLTVMLAVVVTRGMQFTSQGARDLSRFG